MTRLHLIFTALAAIFTILLTPMAMATDAKATAWVNVRSGPGDRLWGCRYDGTGGGRQHDRMPLERVVLYPTLRP